MNASSPSGISTKKLRIVFMGTPDFAVASLRCLIDDGQQVVAVITAPDKPAGRGRELRTSPVKEYAVTAGIPIYQPSNLKDDLFIQELQSLRPDLQVVVAFRMLPEPVWRSARIGTINLHASLLPQYRGAAPINWAIINGENITGVTTFFIDHEIDTGEILMRQEVTILPDDTAGTLHDRLRDTGAQLLVKTVNAVASGTYTVLPQSSFPDEGLQKSAPKIQKEDCRIHWTDPAERIRNFIRGLSPYPAAWSELTGENRIIPVKIFRAEALREPHSFPCGSLVSDGKTFLKAAVGDGFIDIKELQLAGKSKLDTGEFLRGFSDISRYRFADATGR
jgi:methionyl-tRNA formyltransferase